MKTHNYKLIVIYSISIIIFGLIPLLWSNDIVLDKVKFTEEWYKGLFSLILILLSYLVFTYLIEKYDNKKLLQEQKRLEDILKDNAEVISSILLSKSPFDPNSQNPFNNYVETIKYARFNLSKWESKSDLTNRVLQFDKNVEYCMDQIKEKKYNIDSLSVDKKDCLINYFSICNLKSII